MSCWGRWPQWKWESHAACALGPGPGVLYRGIQRQIKTTATKTARQKMLENHRASHTSEASEEDSSIGARGPAAWETLEESAHWISLGIQRATEILHLPLCVWAQSFQSRFWCWVPHEQSKWLTRSYSCSVNHSPLPWLAWLFCLGREFIPVQKSGRTWRDWAAKKLYE